MTIDKRKRRLSAETLSRIANAQDVGYSFLDAIAMLRREGAVMYRYDGEPEPVSREARARLAERERREAQLATWNATVPVGTPAMVRSVVDGPEFPSRTRSVAWMLSSGVPTVLIEGWAGGWDLDFIRVVPAEEEVAC